MCLLELWLSQDMFPVVGFLGCRVDIFLLFFEDIYILFSIMAVSVYIPTNSVGELVPFPPHPSAFIVCRFFDDVHSDWCEVIPHCSFDLHFSNN